MKVGSKYYKFIDDNTVRVLRLTKIKNDNEFVMRDSQDNVVKLNKNELESYTLLRPDGYITFSIVGLEQDTRDVIVTLHRRKDIENGDNIPYCVCRQNIFDLFANQIVKDENIYIGVSISKDTCPEDTPYDITMACNTVERTQMVAVYIDDTLDTILSMINQHKYNETLKKMYGSIINPNLKGYCISLKQLLEENYFMYDFLKGFDIEPVRIKINEEDIEYGLTNSDIRYLESLFKFHMQRLYVIKYDKDIDMSSIQRDYVLVSDLNQKIYILTYDKTEESIYNENESYTELYDLPTAKEDYMNLVKYKNNNY